MVFTFSRNPIDRLEVWLMNKHEEYTHYVFNKKPHRVTCKICGAVLSSEKKESPSPEECGWRRIEHKHGWICHMCDAHRNFKPYIDLVDFDERILWGVEKNSIATMAKRDMMFGKTEQRLLDILGDNKS